jgi:hypothetical protein
MAVFLGTQKIEEIMKKVEYSPDTGGCGLPCILA